MTKVTVITVVLNQAADLELTMSSVLALSRPDLDYVVVDGGSSDGSVDVIRANADRLKYWLSEPDKGVYDAMNKGWSLADLDSRIIFLGAGDRLLQLPDGRDADLSPLTVCYGNVRLDNGQMFHARHGFWLRLYNSLHHQALLIPKQLHPAPPFDLAFPLYADFDFNQRLNKAGARFSFDSRLSAYAAPGGLTGDMHLAELTKIISKNYGPFWSLLSRTSFSLAYLLPLFRKLRPIS